MFRMFLICFGTLAICSQGMSQTFEEAKRKQDSIYQINIKKSRINGVYIPTSLEDACKELDALATPETSQAILKFKMAEEEEVAKKLHFGLGRWMKVNWNFEEGSRLSHVLRGYGIHHPDDMVNFMLRSYHRYLNGKDQEVAARAKEYEEAHKARVKKNLEQYEVIDSKTKKLDKPPTEKGGM